MNIRTIRLEEADADTTSRSLYVINSASLDGSLKKQIISIDKATTIQVMDTQFPQDISSDATREAILRSATFRRLVQGGFIRIANPEDVAKLQNDPEWQDEMLAINRRRLSAPAHVHTVTDSTNLTLGNNVVEKKKPVEQQPAVSPKVANFVRNWNLAASNGDAAPTFEDDQVSLMRNMRLPLDEVRYMLENCPPAFTKIRAVLAKCLSQ